MILWAYAIQYEKAQFVHLPLGGLHLALQGFLRAADGSRCHVRWTILSPAVGITPGSQFTELKPHCIDAVTLDTCHSVFEHW